MKTSFLATALLVVLALAVPAGADTIYTYTGNTFEGNGSGSISGSFDLVNALSDNLSFTQITPVSFSFTNNKGLTLTNLTANPNYTSIDVSTNGLGNIVDWSISLYSYSGQQIYTFNNGYYSDDFTTSPNYRSISGDPGRWTSIDPPAVSEPSALLLLSMGLSSLALLGAHRRSRSVRAVQAIS